MSRKPITSCHRLTQADKDGIVSRKRGPIMKTVDATPGRKEEINFMSQDLARTLIVPNVGPKIMKGLINQEKLDQLQKSAMTSLSEEEEAKHKEKVRRHEELLKEKEARKAEFAAYDLARQKNEKLSEIEEEAKQKMEYLRSKANEIIKEENEEIKEINKLILSAKVQAIRDAQIEEKKHIEQERVLAEASLDEVMEEQRKKGVIKEKAIQQKRKEASSHAATKLREQIKENEKHKLISEERKIEEGELLLQKLKKDQMSDYKEMKNKELERDRLYMELVNANDVVVRRKQAMKEMSEKEDKVIAEYQKLKAAQEVAKEAAKRAAREQRELELTKLGKMQEKASELQAEQEALRARRAREEKERQYRKKEKEEALKKKRMLDELKECRDEQIKQRERLRDQQAAVNIQELSGVLSKLRDETKEEKRRELFRKLASLKQLDELKSQMRQKEMERINEKRQFYKEGVHLQQEEKRRNEMLDVLKREKLDELRKYNVPETYINNIKRKVNLKD